MNGHKISKIIFGSPADPELERIDHEEEKADENRQPNHGGTQQDLWPGRKPDENYRSDPNGVDPVLP